MSSTNFIITDPTQMPYYCTQCQTSSGCCQSDFEKHFAGKKHKFNVKKEKRPYYCDLCYFLSPLQNDLEKHLAGIEHKDKVNAKKEKAKENEGATMNMEGFKKDNKEKEKGLDTAVYQR